MQYTDKTVPLYGRAQVPDVPLCALCKIDGSFVLLPVDEVYQMRPDMSDFVKDSLHRDEVIEEDQDYMPSSSKGSQKPKGKTPAKGAAKTVKVQSRILHSEAP
jgi:hypothetical protein